MSFKSGTIVGFFSCFFFFYKAGSHGLVIAIVDHSPLLALLALLLELEVLLKDGRETVPLQHARLVDHLILVGRQRVQVVEEGDIVSWRWWEGERKWKLLAGS